ncbi:hypothetical protein ACHQM5_015808 [Ranunculus cassubicifolius]
MPNSELIKEDEVVELNEPIQTQELPSFPAIRKRARICERGLDTYNVGPSQASSCGPDPGRITRRSSCIQRDTLFSGCSGVAIVQVKENMKGVQCVRLDGGNIVGMSRDKRPNKTFEHLSLLLLCDIGMFSLLCGIQFNLRLDSSFNTLQR